MFYFLNKTYASYSRNERNIGVGLNVLNRNTGRSKKAYYGQWRIKEMFLPRFLQLVLLANPYLEQKKVTLKHNLRNNFRYKYVIQHYNFYCLAQVKRHKTVFFFLVKTEQGKFLYLIHVLPNKSVSANNAKLINMVAHKSRIAALSAVDLSHGPRDKIAPRRKIAH